MDKTNSIENPLPSPPTRNHTEFLNALSMLFPFTTGALFLDAPCARWVAVSWFLIVPVSMTLHFGRYLGKIDDGIDNDIRRLDQTMQICAAPFVAWGLSGHTAFTMVIVIVCVYPLWALWDPPTTNDGKRWRTIGAVIAFATFVPLVHRRQWVYTFLIAILSALCVIVYIHKHNSFMHALFHVLGGVWSVIVCLAAMETCAVSTVHCGPMQYPVNAFGVAAPIVPPEEKLARHS